VTDTRFPDVGVHRLLYIFRTHRSSRRPSFEPPRTHKWHHLVSHSRTSQVRSPCPDKNKGHPTFHEDYRRLAAPKRHAQAWRIPKWLTASGLTIGKQPTSFNVARARHQRDHSSHLGPQPPGPVPFESGFPHSGTHQLDVRRPSPTLKGPTGEASEPNRSSPLSTPRNPIQIKRPTRDPTKSDHSSPLFDPYLLRKVKDVDTQQNEVPYLKRRASSSPPFPTPHPDEASSSLPHPDQRAY
jgi:hypothetical protein